MYHWSAFFPKVDALKAAEAAKRKEAAREHARQKQKEALLKQKAERAKHAQQVKVSISIWLQMTATCGHNYEPHLQERQRTDGMKLLVNAIFQRFDLDS